MKSIKGFTLIELLVVVLIIGVIAGIAVPQYRKMVLRTHYATLKTTVRYIADRQEEFYRGNGRLGDFYELGMDIGKITGRTTLKINNDIDCDLVGVTDSWSPAVLCSFKEKITHEYYNTRPKRKSIMCVAHSTNEKDIYNKLCQTETGKKKPASGWSSSLSYRVYYY